MKGRKVSIHDKQDVEQARRCWRKRRRRGKEEEEAPEQDFHHSPLDPVCRLTHEPPAQHGVSLESRDDGRMGGGGGCGVGGKGEEVRRVSE